MIGEDKNRELALMVLWHGADLLVQDRTHDPEGGLGFWGGRIKQGETPLAAALREQREELYIKNFKTNVVTAWEEPIEEAGWRIHAFQALLRYGVKYKAKEGEAKIINPMEMWEDPRLMKASRAILKELILEPNGLIDHKPA